MSILSRLGLHRRELRAWAMYDWANSSFATTIITAIFPVYFTSVAAAGLSPAEATRRLATATTVALAISAILAPILGAIADYAPIKKRLLGAFMMLGALASGALFLIQRGDWIAAALLLVPPALVTWRAASFEGRRWSQSDFSHRDDQDSE